ncbi:MAG: glycosyltransferase family 2 protein [Candidatus Omnitrophota bacterium]|nr:glycosyltransferase family 2 protein [Candidatus Omnitrophota bacterium]
MKLSVIIPVYNEENSLPRILPMVQQAPLPPGVGQEIVIVDDGSTDATPNILEGFRSDQHVKILRHDRNRGKTAAVLTGLRAAAGDIFLIQDADLEYHPSHYPRLLEPILRDKASVVYGSRFKGRILGMRPVNRWANRVSNITFNLLYGTRITDINTCFKVFTRDAFRDMDITTSHFGLDTELTAKLVRRGYAITEVPIDYAARSVEEGKKITWIKAVSMYAGIFRFRFGR